MRRCRVESVNSCDCNDGSVKVYTKTSFKLIYTFTDHRYVPTLIIPPSDIEFEFKYSVLGREGELIASHIGDEWTNCFMNQSTKELVVLFKDHELPPGQLVVEYHFLVHDPAFPNKMADRYDSELTGVVLTDNLLEI